MRTDYFASQVINFCLSVFKEKGVDIFLQPLVTISSANGGIIKTCTNTISIDKIKKEYVYITSLKQFFMNRFGSSSTAEYIDAISCFCKSLAGYALVSYLLQVRDRNNGNILVDSYGHIIHIDFEYLLNKSPGSLHFENAPFKLTTEYMEILEGQNYIYFSGLFIKGFRAIRANWQIFLSFLRVYFTVNSDLECFADKDKLIQTIRERLMLNVDDSQIESEIDDLISLSKNSWRTSIYDSYQKYCVGIR
jgi:phosphatidylinositol 4-kinase